jgi:hypothetical protein
VAEQDLYWDANIKGFPTIKLFIMNQVVPYNGNRDLESLLAFARKFKTPRLIELNTFRAFNKYIDEEVDITHPLLIGFGAEEERAELELACTIFDRNPCAVSASREAADQLGVPYPSFALIRRFPREDEVVQFDRSAAVSSSPSGSIVDGLLDFLRRRSFPAVVELSGDFDDLLFAPDRPGFENHVIFPVYADEAEGLRVLNIAQSLAPDFYGFALFAFIDLSKTSRFITNLIVDLEIDRLNPPLALVAKSERDVINFFRLKNDDNNEDLLSKSDDDLRSSIKQWTRLVLRGDMKPAKALRDSSGSSQAMPKAEAGDVSGARDDSKSEL